MRNTRKFGQILRSKKRPRPTPRSGRGSRINCNTSHQIPVQVIEAENAYAASMPAPARFSNLRCPPFAPESEHPTYAPQGRKSQVTCRAVADALKQPYTSADRVLQM